MSNDFATFCLQAGVALLIALLAWGDQIRQPRRMVTEVVQRFLDKVRRSRKELAPIIENSYDRESRSLRYSLSEVTKVAVRLMNAGQLDAANIKIIEKLQDLSSRRKVLESKYETRYFLTIVLTVAFGFVALLSFFNGSTIAMTISGDNLTFDELYSLPIIGVSSWIVVNLVLAYFKENSFIEVTEEANDLIGTK